MAKSFVVPLIKAISALGLGAAFGWFCCQRLDFPVGYSVMMGGLLAFVGVCLSLPGVSVWGVLGAGLQLFVTKHVSGRAGAAAYRWMTGESDGKGETPAEVDPERQRLGAALHTRWADLGFDQLFPEEQDYLAILRMNAAVTEGNLADGLAGDAGEHAPRAVAALERFGSTKLGPLVRQAMNLLPLHWSSDWNRRRVHARDIPQETLDQLTEEYITALETEPEVGDLAAEQVAARYRREQLPF